MRWTVEEVARALGVTPPGGVDALARLAGVSIDSRTVAPGELFVAIHGPRHDGHNFVVAALDAGALAGVVAADRLSGYSEPYRSKLFAVPDTLAALQDLAQAVRPGGGSAWRPLPGRLEKPQRRKFWRRCWPRGSAY